MKTLIQKWLGLKRDDRGIAYVEFAVALPFLLTLFMGSVEVTRFILIAQKVEKSSVTISDVVAQSENIGTTQLNLLITAVGEVMRPYTFNTNGYVIISSVTRTGVAAPVLNWQYRGGGTWSHTSRVATTQGQVATLPNGLTLNDRDTVIVAEVFYNFQPMFAGRIIPGQEIYKVAVFKPRLGNLQTLGS